MGFKYLLAGFLGLIIGVLVTFLATPLLWKMEDYVPLELAGHSGPADWVLLTGGLIGAVVNVLIFWRLGRRK